MAKNSKISKIYDKILNLFKNLSQILKLILATPVIITNQWNFYLISMTPLKFFKKGTHTIFGRAHVVISKSLIIVVKLIYFIHSGNPHYKNSIFITNVDN